MQCLISKLALSVGLAVFTASGFASTPIPTPIVATSAKKLPTPTVKPTTTSPVMQQNIAKTATSSIAKTSTSTAKTATSAKPLIASALSIKPAPVNINRVGYSGQTASPTDGSDLITSTPTRN